MRISQISDAGVPACCIRIPVADFIGWIGSVAFAICGLPQAWQCYKSKTASGINYLFVALWLIGEVCYVISVLMKFGWVSWMMFNYLANIFSISVIIYYMLKDRRSKKTHLPDSSAIHQP